MQRHVRICGGKWEILNAFQWIIHGIKKINWESSPQMCCIFCHFHTITAKYKGKKKIIMRRFKGALSTDILVIPCHIKIPSAMLFAWSLNIKIPSVTLFSWRKKVYKIRFVVWHDLIQIYMAVRTKSLNHSFTSCWNSRPFNVRAEERSQELSSCPLKSINPSPLILPRCNSHHSQINDCPSIKDTSLWLIVGSTGTSEQYNNLRRTVALLKITGVHSAFWITVGCSFS